MTSRVKSRKQKKHMFKKTKVCWSASRILFLHTRCALRTVAAAFVTAIARPQGDDVDVATRLPSTNMESASGFRSDAAPEMDAFLRQRGMQRRAMHIREVLLAPVAQGTALQQATADLRSDARTSNASWIKAYQRLLRHLRRQDHRARQHGAPVGSRQAMIHSSFFSTVPV